MEQNPAKSDEPVTMAPAPEIVKTIVEKINDAHNVLVALSSDPTVDEMAAAIGLSLYLDRLGKRATAIYSGTTPNALQFLKPGDTFEKSADALQDFVIALNKDKADHLRYKLDGDYVKIFVTPYKTRVSQEDLSFSYGDFNVDLVLALNVANGIDLDGALREHGRIMHDAVIVNITTSNPGKLGEIEWSNKHASSVSEMVARLVYETDKDKAEGDDATALLTGIVAATNRFSNAKTTPETMQVSSFLMAAGANQQLVAKNITDDVDNRLLTTNDPNLESGIGTMPMEEVKEPEAPAEPAETAEPAAEPEEPVDASNLAISHSDTSETNIAEAAEEENATSVAESETTNETTAAANEASVSEPEAASEPASETSALETTETTETSEAKTETSGTNVAEPTLPTVEPKPAVEMPDDLMAAAADLAKIGQESVPSDDKHTMTLDELQKMPDDDTASTTSSGNTSGILTEPSSGNTSGIITGPSTPSEEGLLTDSPEKVLQPLGDLSKPDDSQNKYGQMLEAALAAPVPVENPHPDLPPVVSQGATNVPSAAPSAPAGANPAMSAAPTVPSAPEINGVPEMNFSLPADAEILPPPPAPPVDMNAPLPTPSMPATPPAPSPVIVQPTTAAAPATPTVPGGENPGAFKIPGA